jgi:hypothetical protein
MSATTPRPPFGTLAHEFPDFDPATMPEIPAGFAAAHWHHETCPHWIHGEDDVPHMELFIDYPDPERREFPDEARYSLHWLTAPLKNLDSWLIENTDDWAKILDAIRDIEPRRITAKWVRKLGRGFHPDTPGRDYVEGRSGVRCLTNAEADEYDADIDRLFALGGDPYQHGLAAMRVAGLLTS